MIFAFVLLSLGYLGLMFWYRRALKRTWRNGIQHGLTSAKIYLEEKALRYRKPPVRLSSAQALNEAAEGIEMIRKNFFIVALAAFIFAGCGGYQHPVIFETECDMTYVGNFVGEEVALEPGTYDSTSRQWNQKDVNASIKECLYALDHFAAPNDSRFELTPFTYQNSCDRLKGYQIGMHNSPNWHDSGRNVAGLTSCMYGVITIGNVPPNEGALCHELAHAIQQCDPQVSTEPGPGEDRDHNGWVSRGIYAGITDVFRRAGYDVE